MTIGGRVKELREARHLSQQQLATALGLSQAAIHWYETGQRRISYEMMKAIARVLEVNLLDLDPEASPNFPKPAMSGLTEPVAGAA